MAHSQIPTTLDLHGRRLEEAISEVTLFLERIRRTVAAYSRGMAGGHNTFFVKIITGAGSHSSHGPILRSAVQKLLEKRGMVFKLERGGGAFHVDALSGSDLYDPGPATCSKVLVTDRDEFHQMASSLRRRNNGGDFAHAANMPQCTARSRPPRAALAGNGGSSSLGSSSEPLPSQVASEESEIRTAVKASVTETQRQRSRHERESKAYEREYQNVVSMSEVDYVNFNKEKAEAENEEETLLKLAHEQSLVDEQHRQHLVDKEYEEALMLALEKSTGDADKSNATEDELLQQALAESMALAEAEKSNNAEDDILKKVLAESLSEGDNRITLLDHKHDSDTTNGTNQSTGETDQPNAREYDLIQRALAESMALAEAEKISIPDDDVPEKVLAESILKESNHKELCHLEQEQVALSTGIDILAEVKRLSLEQQEVEAQVEEEAMTKAIEMSKNTVW
mmetsp:Transcript_9003/g.21931  ORF Transcript_9003/g.21931 Transcript_9003/m.21931 type:complete len:454 (-) Transcript_9003:71-1432(-)|eukprot:CAMPEP_0181120978 /NCGR_PEP_ID=MMETSP1071-20121207/24474_1 /TAXON_ID=35127 /ORGANISM="Thalassiosira sp., Strain NH16" /LENGTH=453 /DNA_ID=CAMNT_0023205729 /DNA_START=254 /DNA_END=1615 /DNA_ORIENTATION=-